MKHLFFPASFFPSIGGAQGSLLNFLHCIGNDQEIFLALGMRSFLFSLIKRKKFSLTLPYFGRMIKNDGVLSLYLFILARFVNPDIIWLYGGGELAARILSQRQLFSSKTKFVVRSMGSDIQYDGASNYGTKKGSQKYKYITEMYKKANFLWALSEEIATIYKKDLLIENERIILCGNCIIRPSLKGKMHDPQTVRIGLIGRNHPKKNFTLLNSIIERLDQKKFSFILKTPGFELNKRYENVTYEPETSISNLIYWPPQDVWDFYNKVDIVLILSSIESFGNVTFEAGLSNCTIIINKNITGANLAKQYGFEVVTFDTFDPHAICLAIQKVKKAKKTKTHKNLNHNELVHLVQKVVNG